MKGIRAAELRKRNNDELLAELKKQREELQSIRFTKVSGTAVANLSKIKTLRKNIARTLTVINNNRKTAVIAGLRNRYTTNVNAEGVSTQTFEKQVKNIKARNLPTNLRPKRTRALRRALTKSQSQRLSVRVLKRKLNFPTRRFAVPLK